MKHAISANNIPAQPPPNWGCLWLSSEKPLEQSGWLAVLLAVTPAALDGMMVPTFVMPDFMQTLARITPHAWALASFQDVIVRGL
ncbi:MAG: hypothetical protein QGG60_11490, partial [Anaerolineales bacterium]|nr:hypothetical protein [Anaerolineales bacterium]